MANVNDSPPETRLEALDIDLPPPPEAVAAYEPWIRTGDLVVTSGQLPWDGDDMAYTGKLGTDLTVEEGYAAARLATINGLAQLKDATGSLDQISQIVRVEGNVHAGADFRGQPEVLDGASELLRDVFGERSGHTRTALGTNEMPLNAAVQLSFWAEVTE